MRFPFGEYTDIEILDTLEVVAHERYEELLEEAGVLNEAFVDYRTRAALRSERPGADGGGHRDGGRRRRADRQRRRGRAGGAALDGAGAGVVARRSSRTGRAARW